MRVFLRADLNVPLKNGNIVQDFRLQSILPTIKDIQQKGNKVILATHIGRPQAQTQTNFFDENLSTKIMVDWFIKHGFKITYEPDLIKAKLLSKGNVDEILLLENMRFFNGEQGTPEERKAFAALLKDLADFYVNDAFALFHRNDCSVTKLPQLFDPKNRSYGLLFKKEVEQLTKLKENVAQPFVLVVGGKKIKSKIPMLQNFLTTKAKPAAILIGGAIAYTFLHAQEIDVGSSPVEQKYIGLAKTLLEQAEKAGVKVLLPEDHVVINGTYGDIGPKTIKRFCDTIKTAKTIFINGTMGWYEKEGMQKGTKKMLACIVQNKDAYKVAGGGDCIAAIHLFNLKQSFDFLSTGGGATLHFLGKNTGF